MSESKELYTSDELIAALTELGADAHLLLEEGETDEDVDACVECTFGEAEWSIVLGDESLFYSHAVLLAAVTVPVSENPLWRANTWNKNHFESVAVADVNLATGQIEVNGSGDFTVFLRGYMTFAGGVTEEQLSLQLQIWIEDLEEFVEMGTLGEGSQGEDLEVATVASGPAMTDLDLIHEVLNTHGPMSSKQLAEVLVLPKHDVNHLIYMHLEDFEKHPGQPPKWSSRN
jgi:hypothetical protein